MNEAKRRQICSAYWKVIDGGIISLAEFARNTRISTTDDENNCKLMILTKSSAQHQHILNIEQLWHFEPSTGILHILTQAGELNECPHILLKLS